VIVVAAFALVMLSVPLCGGRLGRLARLELRHSWLVAAAFLGQLAVISVVPDVGDTVGKGVHLASYALAAMFVVANRRLPGITLLAVGGGLNLVAIVANGGVMPASDWAVRVAGLTTTAGEFANSRSVEAPKMLLFGDIFAIPAGWPLANVFSVGDVVLVVGAAYSLHVICGSRLTRRAHEPAALDLAGAGS
jgi:hypothetical protein